MNIFMAWRSSLNICERRIGTKEVNKEIFKNTQDRGEQGDD